MTTALNDRDIAIIKGMLLRGDNQHDIAALFGCNAGRVAEVHNGIKGNGGKMRGQAIAAVPLIDLPPAGPYHLNLRAPHDIIVVALENVLEPLALAIGRLEKALPRDEPLIQRTRLALAEARVALAERQRELWRGRKP